MVVSRAVRIRIMIFTLILFALWFMYFGSMKSNEGTIKDTTGVGGVESIPEMVYGVNEEDGKIKVAVFYECLCPDSRSFFVNQLLPVMEAIPAYLSTELVPYGKASTEVISEGLYKFKCQHGPLECLGNKIHACALERIKDDLTKVKIVTCMIKDNYNAQDIGKQCSEMFNINWENIENCAFGTEGNELLKRHGDTTLALAPKVSFIPTILLNKLSRAPEECD